MSLFGLVVRRFARLCTIAGAFALVVMMLATDWDIIARQTFNSPLDGVVEIVEVTVLAVAMLGLPEAFLRNENIRVDLLDTVVGPRGVRVLRAFATVLSLVLLALLTWHVVQPMRDARLFGDLKPDLGLAIWTLYAMILFSFVASALCCMHVLLRLGDADAGGEKEAPK